MHVAVVGVEYETQDDAQQIRYHYSTRGSVNVNEGQGGLKWSFSRGICRKSLKYYTKMLLYMKIYFLDSCGSLWKIIKSGLDFLPLPNINY